MNERKRKDMNDNKYICTYEWKILMNENYYNESESCTIGKNESESCTTGRDRMWK